MRKGKYKMKMKRAKAACRELGKQIRINNKYTTD